MRFKGFHGVLHPIFIIFPAYIPIETLQLPKTQCLEIIHRNYTLSKYPRSCNSILSESPFHGNYTLSKEPSHGNSGLFKRLSDGNSGLSKGPIPWKFRAS